MNKTKARQWKNALEIKERTKQSARESWEEGRGCVQEDIMVREDGTYTRSFIVGNKATYEAQERSPQLHRGESAKSIINFIALS